MANDYCTVYIIERCSWKPVFMLRFDCRLQRPRNVKAPVLTGRSNRRKWLSAVQRTKRPRRHLSG